MPPHDATTGNGNGNGRLDFVANKVLTIALMSVIAIFGVTFKLVLDRMDKSETIAAANISALREEIKSTKSVARDAVAAAAVASNAAVAATATALRDAVTATATASKEAVAATASSQNEKIGVLSHRVEKLEDRAFRNFQDKLTLNGHALGNLQLDEATKN